MSISEILFEYIWLISYLYSTTTSFCVTSDYKKINPEKSHIWSSATLYDKEVRLQREKWFFDWLEKNQNAIDFNVFEFHTGIHRTDTANDILIKPNAWQRTVSLSQINVSKKVKQFKYYDLLSMKAYLKIIKDVKQLPYLKKAIGWAEKGQGAGLH